jgi:2-polyprenyl-6-methoxyphenol hydroxylase-like FAD-dependent oxidoreductase
MEREQETGISILVVGGGIAGLTFAIEAHRKGHDVRVIERRALRETFGKCRTDAKRPSTSLHT